jgi:toxin ParE1/3/4
VRVRYTAGAIHDLAAIVGYITDRDPRAAIGVSTTIRNAIDVLEQYPLVGHAQDMPRVRKLVVRRFGYVVYYSLNEAADAVDILTIRHPARARPFQDE